MTQLRVVRLGTYFRLKAIYDYHRKLSKTRKIIERKHFTLHFLNHSKVLSYEVSLSIILNTFYFKGF